MSKLQELDQLLNNYRAFDDCLSPVDRTNSRLRQIVVFTSGNGRVLRIPDIKTILLVLVRNLAREYLQTAAGDDDAKEPVAAVYCKLLARIEETALTNLQDLLKPRTLEEDDDTAAEAAATGVTQDPLQGLPDEDKAAIQQLLSDETVVRFFEMNETSIVERDTELFQSLLQETKQTLTLEEIEKLLVVLTEHRLPYTLQFQLSCIQQLNIPACYNHLKEAAIGFLRQHQVTATLPENLYQNLKPCEDFMKKKGLESFQELTEDDKEHFKHYGLMSWLQMSFERQALPESLFAILAKTYDDERYGDKERPVHKERLLQCLQSLQTYQQTLKVEIQPIKSIRDTLSAQIQCLTAIASNIPKMRDLCYQCLETERVLPSFDMASYLANCEPFDRLFSQLTLANLDLNQPCMIDLDQASPVFAFKTTLMVALRKRMREILSSENMIDQTTQESYQLLFSIGPNLYSVLLSHIRDFPGIDMSQQFELKKKCAATIILDSYTTNQEAIRACNTSVLAKHMAELRALLETADSRDSRFVHQKTLAMLEELEAEIHDTDRRCALMLSENKEQQERSISHYDPKFESWLEQEEARFVRECFPPFFKEYLELHKEFDERCVISDKGSLNLGKNAEGMEAGELRATLLVSYRTAARQHIRQSSDDYYRIICALETANPREFPDFLKSSSLFKENSKLFEHLNAEVILGEERPQRHLSDPGLTEKLQSIFTLDNLLERYNNFKNLASDDTGLNRRIKTLELRYQNLALLQYAVAHKKPITAYARLDLPFEITFNIQAYQTCLAQEDQQYFLDRTCDILGPQLLGEQKVCYVQLKFLQDLRNNCKLCQPVLALLHERQEEQTDPVAYQAKKEREAEIEKEQQRVETAIVLACKKEAARLKNLAGEFQFAHIDWQKEYKRKYDKESFSLQFYLKMHERFDTRYRNGQIQLDSFGDMPVDIHTKIQVCVRNLARGLSIAAPEKLQEFFHQMNLVNISNRQEMIRLLKALDPSIPLDLTAILALVKELEETEAFATQFQLIAIDEKLVPLMNQLAEHEQAAQRVLDTLIATGVVLNIPMNQAIVSIPKIQEYLQNTGEVLQQSETELMKTVKKLASLQAMPTEAPEQAQEKASLTTELGERRQKIMKLISDNNERRRKLVCWLLEYTDQIRADKEAVCRLMTNIQNLPKLDRSLEVERERRDAAEEHVAKERWVADAALLTAETRSPADAAQRQKENTQRQEVILAAAMAGVLGAGAWQTSTHSLPPAPTRLGKVASIPDSERRADQYERPDPKFFKDGAASDGQKDCPTSPTRAPDATSAQAAESYEPADEDRDDLEKFAAEQQPGFERRLGLKGAKK